MFETKHKLRLKIIDLEFKIESLNIDLKWAKKREEEAEKKLGEKRAQETEKARNASIYVEWDHIKLVSIERRLNELGVSLTEIGYLIDVVENGHTVEKVKSWVFYCSDEIHEALIEDYEEWKAKREYDI